MDAARIVAGAVLATLCWACDGGIESPVEGPFECVDLPTSTCERLLADAQQGFPGVPVVRAVIRCTVAVCTEAEGEASIRVDFANGRFVEQAAGWMQAEPAPNPVPPATRSSSPRVTFAP